MPVKGESSILEQKDTQLLDFRNQSGRWRAARVRIAAPMTRWAWAWARSFPKGGGFESGRRSTDFNWPVFPALIALACLCPAAMAESSPWYVGASQSLAYESNLFRVDSRTALGPLSRSDTVSNTSLVAGLDQSFGRQRIYGNAKLGVNRYGSNDYLNDVSYTMATGLDWSTRERISGGLNFAASRNQRSFNVDSGSNVVETGKNSESVAQIDATVRVGVVTRLTMEAELGYRHVGFSAPEYASSEYGRVHGSAGVRYRPGIATFGASINVADSRHGQSPAQASRGQAAEQVRRSSLDLTINWPASGPSSVYARLSPTRVAYDQFTQRDFSGLTGALKWNWLPTGKLAFETRLLHDISQDSNFETFGGPTVVGARNTGLTTTEARLAVEYGLTAKIALNAALGRSHRTLERTTIVSVPSIETDTGSDDTSTLLVGARWTPLRSVQVGCSMRSDQRTASGGLTHQYRANTASCYGQFTLQ